ncbi:hypothetical protein B0H10DRAFT_2220965 [Mycena sp. CBHHK59/15]|nr:hypothetical protein B0H10DRAFT_2220965 [Mycena sp. CBHHK59/15]
MDERFVCAASCVSRALSTAIAYQRLVKEPGTAHTPQSVALYRVQPPTIVVISAPWLAASHPTEDVPRNRRGAALCPCALRRRSRRAGIPAFIVPRLSTTGLPLPRVSAPVAPARSSWALPHGRSARRDADTTVHYRISRMGGGGHLPARLRRPFSTAFSSHGTSLDLLRVHREYRAGWADHVRLCFAEHPNPAVNHPIPSICPRVRAVAVRAAFVGHPRRYLLWPRLYGGDAGGGRNLGSCLTARAGGMRRSFASGVAWDLTSRTPLHSPAPRSPVRLGQQDLGDRARTDPAPAQALSPSQSTPLCGLDTSCADRGFDPTAGCRSFHASSTPSALDRTALGPLALALDWQSMVASDLRHDGVQRAPTGTGTFAEMGSTGAKEEDTSGALAGGRSAWLPANRIDDGQRESAASKVKLGRRALFVAYLGVPASPRALSTVIAHQRLAEEPGIAQTPARCDVSAAPTVCRPLSS